MEGGKNSFAFAKGQIFLLFSVRAGGRSFEKSSYQGMSFYIFSNEQNTVRLTPSQTNALLW